MSVINVDAINNAAADGPPDFPLGLTSEGNPVGGLKEWAVLTDYNEDDVVFSGGADSTLNKIYKASITHQSGAVSLLADIANWTELSEQSAVPYNIVISPGDDIVAIIGAAVAGDRVYILDGTYTITARIVVPKGISITGESRDGVIVIQESTNGSTAAFSMIDYNIKSQFSQLSDAFGRDWDAAATHGTATTTYNSTLITLSVNALAQDETGKFISLDGDEYEIIDTPTASTLNLDRNFRGYDRANVPYIIMAGDSKTYTTLQNLTIKSNTTSFGDNDFGLGVDGSNSANIILKDLTVNVLSSDGANLIGARQAYNHYYENILLIGGEVTQQGIEFESGWKHTTRKVDMQKCGFRLSTAFNIEEPFYKGDIQLGHISLNRDQNAWKLLQDEGCFKSSFWIKSITSQGNNTEIVKANTGGFMFSYMRIDHVDIDNAATPCFNFDVDIIEGSIFEFGYFNAVGSTELINIRSHDITLGRANIIKSGTFLGTIAVQGCIIGGAVQAEAYTDGPAQNNGYTF